MISEFVPVKTSGADGQDSTLSGSLKLKPVPLRKLHDDSQFIASSGR